MELKFLQQEDYLTFISENSLSKRLRDNAAKLVDCENAAFGHIYDKLSQRYRISQEIERQGRNRNPSWFAGWLSWQSITSISPARMMKYRNMSGKTMKMY